MSFTESTFYAAVCDWPGCGAMDDDGEYRYWDDKQSAVDSVTSGEWLQEEWPGATADDGTRMEQRLFCPQHLGHVRWLADDEDATAETEDVRVITLPDGEAVVLA